MSRRPAPLLLFFLLVSGVVAAESSAPGWPAVNRETKPWSRWWWLGNIADEKSITAEMESYAAAGLGGLELTPIYGVHGYEAQFVPFLSPTWMQNFDHVLAEARRLGLGIDLATGTGWPFGGPWLNDADVAHMLAHRTYSVAAGTTLSEPIAMVAKPLLRFAGAKQVPLEALKEPITANADLQDLAIDQVRFPRPLPLVALIAYPAQGDSLDLTNKVSPTGQLDWTAPAGSGTWTLYALFQGQHGKMVERAAPAAEGYALDHFSSTALSHYLAKFDDAFKGHDTSSLRAFFNDSYEVDDAQGEADFTASFLTEFQQRRGYDLRAHLPDLFATASSDASTRVLSDYRETVSDLLRDQFTQPWQKWAAHQGAKIRNQAHGSPANILDLYVASDIPEQEGGDILAIKLASSAAHVTGKPLASAETGTWLNEHFLSTLGELRSAVDTYLLSGINHNCYHGTAYSPLNDPWPGFQFYASVELNPRNPFWTDFALVNAYVTRAQSFLQTGEPDEDVLLYYNIHDRWAVRGDGSMPHFHGSERDGVGARVTAGALRSAGLGFDYASDRMLETVSSAGKTGRVRGAATEYQAIVVPPTKLMPLKTLQHLTTLAESGATILVLQQLPQSAPGLGRDERAFAALLARINEHAVVKDGVTTASVGQGRLLIGNDLNVLLARHSAMRPEKLGTRGLEYVRRRTADGALYFLVNRGPGVIDSWVPLNAVGAAAALFDPMTGRTGMAAFRSRGADAGSEVYLQLAPGASVVVQLGKQAMTGEAWVYSSNAGEPKSLTGEWTVRFVAGGPALPPAATMSALTSWTSWNSGANAAFSGTAVYSLHFPRPVGTGAAWKLDLGQIGDSARVKLNGEEIAGLIQAPWTVEIPTRALKDQNELEVIVTNLAANRIADLDRRGVKWKKFYNTNMPARRRENTGPDKLFTAAAWSPRPSGLLGPVTLTPLAIFDPAKR
ncbi:MAG: glycosyl hydrolase [Opitutus sp.]